MKQTALTLPTSHEKVIPFLADIERELDEINLILRGFEPKASSEELPPLDVPLYNRLSDLIETQITSTSDITATSKMLFDIIKDEFPPVLEKLRIIAEQKMLEARKLLDEKDAPYTPGRIPVWK
jgi:hypothetical protein